MGPLREQPCMRAELRRDELLHEKLLEEKLLRYDIGNFPGRSHVREELLREEPLWEELVREKPFWGGRSF